ncbi:molybdopterin converting factor subunit 1 [Arenibaculum sp.]|uniref:molybdopterin converting factor subunit 1 n=1 Tax=Arenibaculum sp. TaxID=2865862 RepID=UPI002E0E95DB|nr:molybdopterin converting factor subunit 1 [Arenibaculum sp.]
MKIIYFSWLRTKAGTPAEEIGLPDGVTTVGGLLDHLGEVRPGLRDVLKTPGALRCTVNRRYVDPSHPVAASDEVSIFPPVTGG